MMREKREKLTVIITRQYANDFQKFVIILWYITIGFFINITFKYVHIIYYYWRYWYFHGSDLLGLTHYFIFYIFSYFEGDQANILYSNIVEKKTNTIKNLYIRKAIIYLNVIILADLSVLMITKVTILHSIYKLKRKMYLLKCIYHKMVVNLPS